MPIKNIIAKGIGFSPGSVKFVVTHGFSIGEDAPPEPPPVAVVSAATTIPSFFQSRHLSLLASDPVYYSTRTWSRRVTPLVSRYFHETRSIGGYFSAGMTISDHPSRMEEWVGRGLGRHIEVYNPSLVGIWEGFINQIVITEGGEQFSVGPLINIGNRDKSFFTSPNANATPPIIGPLAVTAVANNTASQTLFGIWEKARSLGQVTATEAAQLRDMLVNDPTRAFPSTSMDSSLLGSGTMQVELQCLGYWHWLMAYFYANTGVTGYEDATTKIQNVLAASPNAVFSTDYSRIATNATLVKKYEAGDRKADVILMEIAGLGDSSNNPYTIGFYWGRRLVYQPMPTAIEYQRRATGNRGITNAVNREIMPWDVLPAQWIFRPDFMIGRHPPISAATLGPDPRAEFIETIQFEAPYGLSINGKKLSHLDQAFARRGLGSAV